MANLQVLQKRVFSVASDHRWDIGAKDVGLLIETLTSFGKTP
jgi:hypothetical protein